jgi:hypothetical protein
MIDTEQVGVLVGVGLILVTVVDISMTVLHVQAESPLSNGANRLAWRLLRGLTAPLPRRLRDEVLAWGLPIMICVDLGLWIVLYVVGFGMVYLPMLDDPALFRGTALPGGGTLNDAIYFSAVTFFTLGYGDVVPSHPLPRLLATIEAASGLLAIALAAAYLLAVYPFIARAMALATSLNQETAGRADGVAAARRYLASGRFKILAARLRWLNDELLMLAQAHALYPILYYAWPRRVHESFVRSLAVTQGLVATLRYALDPDAHGGTVSDPRLVILEEGLLYTLHSLAHSSHLTLSEDPEIPDRSLGDLACLREELGRLDLAVIGEGSPQADAYMRFLEATNPYIVAYAHTLGYDASDVWALYGRWARDAALSGVTET